MTAEATVRLKDETNDTNEPKREWYKSPNWLLLLPVALFGIWMWHNLSATTPSTPIAATAPATRKVVLISYGPNLLLNPTFAKAGAGWTEYHNSQLMKVSYSADEGGEAIIGLNNAISSVQEIYQLRPMGGKPLIASGTIRIAGAPLPPSASAGIMFINSNNTAQNVFSVSASNGIGSFPFKVAYVPNSEAKQFVIAIITGPASNNTTKVSIGHLSVTKQRPN